MNNSFDPLKYVNWKSLSAGGLGSIVAAWALSNHIVFTTWLFIIGAFLLAGGEWYAREVYDNPIKPTYKSVIYGNLILGAGITAVAALIILTGVSQWLHTFMWFWCLVLCGGPQVEWQRRKEEENAAKNKKAAEAASKSNNVKE